MRLVTPEQFKTVEAGLNAALGIEVKRINGMQIKSLNLKSKLDLANQTMAKASTSLDNALARHDGAAAKLQAFAEEVNKSAAEVEAAIGTMTNGAPE